MRSASCALALEQAEQHADGHPPSSASGWRTVVERRRDDRRLLGVVEADDGEVLGDAQAARTRGVR